MGLIDKIKQFLREPVETHRAELMAGNSTFTPFSGNAYESDIYRAAIDAIARNAAKLKGKHIIYSKQNNKRETGELDLSSILIVRTNTYMSAYYLFYNLVTHYYLQNNAYAFLQKDDRGNLQAV